MKIELGNNNVIENSILGGTKYKSPYRKQWEKDKEKDEMYMVDIHVWRHPGMGNSLQTITGNRVSILTAITSLFETLMRETDITDEDLCFALGLAASKATNKRPEANKKGN